MRSSFLIASMTSLVTCGCEPNQGNNPKGQNVAATSQTHAHEHPSKGPHHGTLVELGKEEYHAEIVHQADSLTVYILDSQAKSAVAVDASELLINVIHDGKPEQFKLTPSPEAGEVDGKSSRYTITDAELAAHLDDKAASPKLSISIAGKPYRGAIQHDHDHDQEHAH